MLTMSAARDQPFRIFFPLGILLAWAGVLHWVLHWAGWLGDYRPVFHSITQIQGFMLAFGVGFLFTGIPRRTASDPPAAGLVVLALVALPATVVAAWFQLWGVSQVFFLALAVGLLRFVHVRTRRSPRPVPTSFYWIPWSLWIGIGGSLAAGAFGILGTDYAWLHTLGKLHILQGMFLGLVAGIGGMVLPLLTQGGVPEQAIDRRFTGLHVIALIVLLASFWVETLVSLRLGMALRASAMLLALGLTGAIFRGPGAPGLHRRFVWLATWMIPIGYTVGAILPAYKHVGLHAVFIGGFALLALSVGIHITIAHAGDRRLMGASPRPIAIMGLCLAIALACRVGVELDRTHFFSWLGVAAIAFLLATIAWGSLALKQLRFRRTEPTPEG